MNSATKKIEQLLQNAPQFALPEPLKECLKAVVFAENGGNGGVFSGGSRRARLFERVGDILWGGVKAKLITVKMRFNLLWFS